jgi:hypothetical protein
MTTMPIKSSTTEKPQISSRGLWLISPFYDLTFIIFSSVLLVVPHFAGLLANQISSFSTINNFQGMFTPNVIVDLLVTAFIGGPHLFATYTMTFMEPNFRKRYTKYTWGSLLMPVLVVTLAIINLTLLVTIFFFWASVHVIHQAAYIADSYRFKDPRTSAPQLKRAQVISRVIDYALLLTSLYPVATYRFTGTPFVIGGHDYSGAFETGGRALLFPDFLKVDWLGPLALGVYILCLVAFVVKTIWEARVGLFHLPKTLHMTLASILFFLTPMLANLDVAFQGLNVWHSFQYLAVVLFLNRVRSERGLIGSEFVAKVSSNGRSLYWLCFLFTLGAGMAYVLMRLILILTGSWATDPMQQHYFSFYSVILSALLIHYYFDHFLFLQVDDVITPKWT